MAQKHNKTLELSILTSILRKKTGCNLYRWACRFLSILLAASTTPGFGGVFSSSLFISFQQFGEPQCTLHFSALLSNSRFSFAVSRLAHLQNRNKFPGCKLQVQLPLIFHNALRCTLTTMWRQCPTSKSGFRFGLLVHMMVCRSWTVRVRHLTLLPYLRYCFNDSSWPVLLMMPP